MAESKSTCPEPVCLTPKEWSEIEGSTMAFHAALQHGVQDEGEELLRSVFKRLSSSVVAIQRRVQEGETEDEARTPRNDPGHALD